MFPLQSSVLACIQNKDAELRSGPEPLGFLRASDDWGRHTVCPAFCPLTPDLRILVVSPDGIDPDGIWGSQCQTAKENKGMGSV